MKYFFSIDWGTSSLRIRLVGIKESVVTTYHEVISNHGCAYVNELFKNEKKVISRENYYLNFLRPHLTIPNSVSINDKLTVVISGMATSSIGMREIPYSSLLFNLDGSNLKYEVIPRTKTFNHDIILLSGVCDENDVMRGEETQLMGVQRHYKQKGEALFILPGTHSKHALIRENQLISFRTYITGEMFQLLFNYSLIKNSISKSASIDPEAFRVGVQLSQGNLLHNIFTIRALDLLKNTKSTSNYSLLSGLLIGTELRDISNSDLPIYLCAHGNLTDSYALALQELSLQNQCKIIPYKDVDEAVIYGQKIMLEQVENNFL